MEANLENIISNNNQLPNENTVVQGYPSHEVSFNENQAKPELDILSKDNQLFSNQGLTEGLTEANVLENTANAVEFPNKNGEQLNITPLNEKGNQVVSNTTTNNLNILGENTGTITETTGNEFYDFPNSTLEQYPTEELTKINAPRIFDSKLIDDSKNLLSSYAIGQTAEPSSFPLPETFTTTEGNLQTTTNIKTTVDNNLENKITTDMSVNPSTDISKDPNIDKKIDLSNPKIAELVKKYRTEVVVESREEIKYIPVKKRKYVKILKVYIPKVKKVYVPGKKVVVPIKKKVYVRRPKNVEKSQISPQMSTTTHRPIMTTSTYLSPLSTRTNNFNKVTTSINTNVNNSQLYGMTSINPTMSLSRNDKSLGVSTKVIEIPLSSSISSSNLLQSSVVKPYTDRSNILNYSYAPRVYSRSLSIKRINDYDY